jgi:predicted HTH domain antitoxin
MDTQTITITLPAKPELDATDTVQFLAAKMYEAGKLTLGEAASMARLSKVAFAEMLGDYGVSLINHPVSEMVEDAAKI